MISGLGEKNFRLYENGESRPFSLSKPETPASIVLLVEYSRASFLYFEDIASALQGFLSAAPEGHWYAAAAFSHDLTVLEDFTKSPGKIAAAFTGLPQPTWNEIDTYDAVYEMLDRLERMPGRRVLIFVGSGLDSFSSHNLGEVQKKIEAANVVVFAAGAGSMLRGQFEPYLGSTERLEMHQAEAFLNMLASKSGGQAWFPRFSQVFPDVMRGAFQVLANQYRLEYESGLSADGKFHKVRVEAFTLTDDKRTDYKVRVREGWRFR